MSFLSCSVILNQTATSPLPPFKGNAVNLRKKAGKMGQKIKIKKDLGMSHFGNLKFCKDVTFEKLRVT
jgi:hypothetical protein